jgi:thiamine-phosphate pyrophosphorylase
MNNFKVIVYSAEAIVKDEVYYLNDLLASGVQQLHLRKPNTPKYVLENLIVNIDPRQHSKIVIHHHYDLLDKYDLMGIHLTNKYLDKAHSLNLHTVIQAAKIKNYTLSRAIHTLEELKLVDESYDFVSLSPVFDSISKQGYEGKVSQFVDFVSYKRTNLSVYALGGITKENIKVCKEMGFDGAIALGTIWRNTEPTQNYKELLNSIYQIG